MNERWERVIEIARTEWARRWTESNECCALSPVRNARQGYVLVLIPITPAAAISNTSYVSCAARDCSVSHRRMTVRSALQDGFRMAGDLKGNPVLRACSEGWVGDNTPT